MEILLFLPDTAVLDPYLSVYKSGDECVKTFGGLEVQILVIFTVEGKFVLVLVGNPYYFFRVFVRRPSSVRAAGWLAGCRLA